MSQGFENSRLPWGLTPLLVAIPTAKLLLHLVFVQGYGIFRDELYYLACADHLDWGYVDHPPLSILVLWVGRSLFGDSVFAIRLLSAVAGALTVLFVGLITRRLGGGSPAQLLAMVATTLVPVYLGTNHVYSMNTLELMIWAIAVYLLVRILDGADPRIWLLLGLVLGLGLQNKISVLWLGAGMFIGILLSPQRRLLRSPWPWLGGLVAALVFLPHLLWQHANAWPTLEFMRNATQQKMAGKSIAEFFSDQILIMGPVSTLIWVPGLLWLLVARRARSFRSLGWIYLVVLAILLVSGSSRSGYLSPTYTWLLAAGSIFWAELLRDRFKTFVTLTLVVAIGNLLLAPLAIPVLQPITYVH